MIRRTFGAHAPIQGCQIHKARNVTERLPKHMQATVRRALRQAWEIGDADKAEKLLRNLARRLEGEAPGVAASILEGLDEMLTVEQSARPSAPIAPIARLHQCDREHDGYRSARLPQRQAMAQRHHGIALDSCR